MSGGCQALIHGYNLSAPHMDGVKWPRPAHGMRESDRARGHAQQDEQMHPNNCLSGIPQAMRVYEERTRTGTSA
eukprot:1159355-Pelagomonas_calceolata.AAC.1